MIDALTVLKGSFDVAAKLNELAQRSKDADLKLLVADLQLAGC